MPNSTSRITESPWRRLAHAVRPGPLWLLPPAGALLALAFPNDVLPGAWGAFPPWGIAWLALAPLLWAVQALPGARGRWAAWLFAAGFYLVNLSWLLLFGCLPWALVALLLALAFPLAVWLAGLISPSRRWYVPALALAFTGLEWGRGRGLFGFPWSELGASQVDGPLAAIAAVGGMPLLTLLLLWITGAAVQVIRERRAAAATLLAGLGALALAGLLGAAQARAAVSRWAHSDESQRIVLVQPNVLKGLTPSDFAIAPSDDELERRLERTLRLSYLGASTWTQPPARQLIVWPESSLRSPPYNMRIPQLSIDTHSFLLLGAPGWPEWTNAGTSNRAYLFDPYGVQVNTYDKVHLVPFGEFVPLRPLIDRLYTVRASDIQPGRGHAVLRQTGVPMGLGICFESTFADIARHYADEGARQLIFITNDAWFHQTAGARQHFTHARFRALETGLPVARAAATGISGFIAPDGRILNEIPVYREDVLARDLPAGRPGTIFTRGGWLLGPSTLVAALILAILGAIRTRRR